MRRLRTVVRRPNLDHQTQLAVQRASQHASRSPQDSTVLAAEAGPFGLHTCGGQQEAVLCKPVQASHFPSGGEGHHNALDYCGPLRTTAVGCEAYPHHCGPREQRVRQHGHDMFMPVGAFSCLRRRSESEKIRHFRPTD